MKLFLSDISLMEKSEKNASQIENLYHFNKLRQKSIEELRISKTTRRMTNK